VLVLLLAAGGATGLSAQTPDATAPPYGHGYPPSEPPTAWTPHQPVQSVLPASYHAPLPPDSPPPDGQPAASANAAATVSAAPPLEAPSSQARPSGASSAESAASSEKTDGGMSLAPPREDTGESLQLAPPADRAGNGGGGLPSAVTVVGSLALVLGLFFLVAWAMRRTAPAAGATLPGEVFEVLGRAPMSGRQQAYLLRCGNRLVLVSVGAEGSQTLTEITDATEVDRLAGLCRQARPNSATAVFRQVFQQFAPSSPAQPQPEPATGGGSEDRHAA